ncbi:uncharacterized protein PV09_07105 [Verruconis gallopava]|uniref:J domain-containing protein n=2 Tax=Verruconis gallopava TaxID=253628 RepID=A0A0D2A4D8_9PEZI|nr:uncharacterized protein PV09_07105 [Verruconis gallopava]KIW01330.1 hypothetical protein PV09_07105 [Verruconis gallopava]
MRPTSIAALLLSLFTVAVVAWSKEDHEIFQLNDAVRNDIGANVTFYDWIGISPSADQKTLNRAYRKKASDLHPDKAKSRFISQYKKKHGKEPTKREITAYYKEAEKRFGRFSVVGNIMRGEGRDRYDYFLKNGFPKWRGTGYYYSRYRPGTGTVLVGLFVMMGGVAHYAALQLSHKRHKDFVERYIKHARKMAWGDSTGIAGIPGASNSPNGTTGFESLATQQQEDGQAQNWNRKQRRLQEKENKKLKKDPKAVKNAREKGISTPVDAELISGPVGTKKRVIAENGKVLIVDSVGNVYVEEQTEEGDTIELLLDIDAIEKPTVYDTVLFRLPAFVYRKTIGRFLRPHEAVLEQLTRDEHETIEDAALDCATSINANEESERRKPKVRRK